MTYYTTAIWWPKDGSYGGHSLRFESLERAREDASVSVRLGYGRKNNPIHIIKHTESEVVAVIDDQQEEK